MRTGYALPHVSHHYALITFPVLQKSLQHQQGKLDDTLKQIEGAENLLSETGKSVGFCGEKIAGMASRGYVDEFRCASK